MPDLNEVMYSLGKSDALDLRSRAKDMDGTAIINEEGKVPKFRNIDYTKYPVGSPVKSLGQVYKLLQPYDASVHKELPKDARDRWTLCHTKNPERAKEWVDALGTSGLYEKNECYKDENGKVWRCIVEQINFSAKDYPQAWKEIKVD